MPTQEFPSLGQLIAWTVEALRDLGGSGTNAEIVEKVIVIGNVPEEIQEIPHKNGRQSLLEYKLHWARSFLKKADSAINSARGVWALTQEGEHLTKAACLDMPRRVRQMDAQHRQQLNMPPDEQTPQAAPEGEVGPEVATDDTTESLDEDWTTQLLEILRAMDPYAFERLAQRVLRESGFTKVEVTGKSGDGGIDGQGVLRVNLVSFRVFFQCKRYSGAVTAGQVRDFRGAMAGRGDKGLLITTGTFTRDAEREATRDGAPAIDLVRGEELCELLREKSLGVTTQTVTRTSVDARFFTSL